jgi:putative SOS response-associated peptidase YedK
MCNEFRFEDSLDDILQAFSELRIEIDWEGGRPNIESRASIRPTDPAFLLMGREGGGARLAERRWGFPGQRGPIINFRSDGRVFKQGRCLVPVSGFYEFTGAKAPKSKWLFTASDGAFLGVAGLIRDERFTLLTCPPGPDMTPYHDRQIAILPRADWAAWLDWTRPAPAISPLPSRSLAVTQVR